MSIVFGDYTPSKEDNKDLNDVYIGVFFDGTSNNRKNIEGRRKDPMLKNTLMSDNDGSNTSYGNDHTNVDKLQKAYPKDKEKHYYSIYVEGIGTKNPEENEDGSLRYYGDFTRGQGYGTGETGLFEKVEKGCFDIVKILKKEGEKKIDSLYIDIFGFSRGATAARIFVNELYKTKNPKNNDSYNLGYLGKAFKELDYKIKPLRIKIRFLGLYDTVSSYGSNVFDDITKDKLPLHIPNVGFTVHLTAEDEHRKKFPLTNIDSAGYNSKELILPGVHSDIGGGYKNLTNDNADEGEIVILTETSSTIKFEKQRALDHGWYQEYQLEEHSKYLKGTRKKLSNEYSLVILHLMAEFGKRKYNIPWNYKNVLDKDYKIPSLLLSIKKRLDEYAFEGKPKMTFFTKKELEEKEKRLGNKSNELNLQIEDHRMLMNLRRKYLHCSASMDGAGMEPNKKYNLIDIDWKRKVISG
ncbi:DUF2235 domain-containing protein [Flavobacterium sp. MR2016-29]|uniref:T6SS phospholipase effector Tle1-like catalytic domain-containing protein n=1 Tax=Flavobacterium sp. MR2016-29 TaxID=2783795 RepID=UPI00188CBB5C|nr:DUF2235 domain-containing protein [Flavobacterium sp. MR2016-29]MBF4491705.1 DUF2235 domain-containing protein [Flavobacterium sp. MR2016-29]